jgi:hypothetical protein
MSAPADVDKDKEPKKRSIWSRAFWNQYNLILLGGVGLFAVATWSWLPLLVGAGAEALWMTLGADSRLFRHWASKQDKAEQRKLLWDRSQAMLATLKPGYIERYEELRDLAGEIDRLARENPSLEARLVQKEMDKLGQILQTFIEMAALHQRYGRFLVDNPERDMQRDIESAERALERESDREVKRGLQQSLALARKRLAQRGRIEATFRLLGVRMDTLEKSMRYLQSHIISIGRTEELSQEIQNLLAGVESVEALNLDIDQMVGRLPGDMA